MAACLTLRFARFVLIAVAATMAGGNIARAADCNALVSGLSAFASDARNRLSAIVTTNQAAGRDAGVATVTLISTMHVNGQSELRTYRERQYFSDRGNPRFTGDQDEVEIGITPTSVSLTSMTWGNTVVGIPVCGPSVMTGVFNGNQAFTVSFTHHRNTPIDSGTQLNPD